ncbi:hypothetical protein GGI35DRAFT_295878 [Trichoderma velutinum]
MVGPLVRWEQIARLVESVRPGICQHLECSASVRRFCRHDRQVAKPRVDRRLSITSLMGGWENSWEGFKAENFNTEKGSCLLCATDYDMSLEQDKSKKEWNFTLSTYHCLGPCRTPNDQLWAYFTSFHPLWPSISCGKPRTGRTEISPLEARSWGSPSNMARRRISSE